METEVRSVDGKREGCKGWVEYREKEGAVERSLCGWMKEVWRRWWRRGRRVWWGSALRTKEGGGNGDIEGEMMAKCILTP